MQQFGWCNQFDSWWPWKVKSRSFAEIPVFLKWTPFFIYNFPLIIILQSTLRNWRTITRSILRAKAERFRSYLNELESDLSRSPKVKQIKPSVSHHMSSYMWSLVTTALSRSETLFSADVHEMTFQWSNWLHHPIRSIWVPIVFYSNYSAISHRNHVFSRWPWSDLSRSPKVKLITPYYSQHTSSYTSSTVTTYSAISHRNPERMIIWSLSLRLVVYTRYCCKYKVLWWKTHGHHRHHL